MKTTLKQIKKKKTKIESAIKEAKDVEVDAIWAILKYRDIGILRKIKCMGHVLNICEDDILEEMPKDDEGRFLDRPTRNLIHNALIRRSTYETTKK